MTAQVQVNITHTRPSTVYRYGRSETSDERFVLAKTTAQMDDRVCAAMLRGLADALDPPVVQRDPVADLMRGGIQ